MEKCMCIGCNNIATRKVKENETGSMLMVCDNHIETVNKVIKKEYEPPK